IFVLDVGRTPVPFHGVEGIDAAGTEVGRNLHGTRESGFLMSVGCGRNTTVGSLSMLCTHHAFLNKILRFPATPRRPGSVPGNEKTNPRRGLESCRKYRLPNPLNYTLDQ